MSKELVKRWFGPPPAKKAKIPRIGSPCAWTCKEEEIA